MKVFLTGAAGFIGNHFLEDLVQHRYEVICSVRTSEQVERIKLSGAVPWIGDLHDSLVLRPVLQGMDAVIHAAGCRDLTRSKTDFEINNVRLTQSVLSAASAAGVRQFIFISAASVVMQEPRALINADESGGTTRQDYLPYSSSKAAAEALVLNLNSENMRTVVLRPSFVWGRGDAVDGAIGPASHRGQFGWFSQGRYPFATCSIANLCDALNKALLYAGQSTAFFISDREPLEFREFMLSRLKAGGYQAPRFSIPRRLAWWLAAFTENGWNHLPLPGKPPLVREMVRLMGYPFTVSIEKARTQLGYEAPHAIEEQMRIIKTDIVPSP